MNIRIVLLTVLLFSLALSACAPTVLTPSPGDIQTAIAQTAAAQPADTATPEPPTATLPPTATPTPSATPTNTPRGPISGRVNAAFLNMRGGPSTLFGVLNTYIQGDELQAVARSADTEWVQVQMDDDEQVGWMSTLFVELDEEPDGLPVADLQNAETLRGRVEDTDGNPIPFIGIAVINREGLDELRADVRSDENGEWALVLPANSYTLMDVQIVGYGCDSPVMDADCRLSGYYEQDGREFVNLPQEGEVLFVFAPVARTISGIVLDEEGEPVADMLVVGERDDGAEALAYTDSDGVFTIGVDSGVWELYAVVLDDGREEGERLTVEVGEDDVADIELTAP